MLHFSYVSSINLSVVVQSHEKRLYTVTPIELWDSPLKGVAGYSASAPEYEIIKNSKCSTSVKYQLSECALCVLIFKQVHAYRECSCSRYSEISH